MIKCIRCLFFIVCCLSVLALGVFAEDMPGLDLSVDTGLDLGGSQESVELFLEDSSVVSEPLLEKSVPENNWDDQENLDSKVLVRTSEISRERMDRPVSAEVDALTQLMRNGSATFDVDQKTFQFYFTLVVVVIWFLTAYPIMLIAQKLDMPNAWMAWIPLFQFVLLLQMGDKPFWWMMLIFIPGINTFAVVVMMVLIWMRIAEDLNKPAWIGMLIVMPIFSVIMPWYLAFAKSAFPVDDLFDDENEDDEDEEDEEDEDGEDEDCEEYEQ